MDKKKKWQVVIIVTALFLCGILYLFLGPGRVQTVGENPVDLPVSDSVSRSASGETVTGVAAAVYIYICGAVKKPGVYTFDHSPRIVEVVEQAGGFTKKADPASVNLASCLEDGAQIVVYEKHANGSQQAVPESGNGSSGTTDGNQTGADRININTAGPEELKMIPGIGDAKAAAIVNYRQENGRFQKIEDLMQVSGIKQGTFDKLKDYITV